jgi:hypothetical protein
MAVVHCRVDSDFLTNGEIVDIGSDFGDGAAELMSQSYWEFCTSIRISGAFGRHKDRTSQVLMEISPAYTAVCDLEPDFIATTSSVML